MNNQPQQENQPKIQPKTQPKEQPNGRIEDTEVQDSKQAELRAKDPPEEIYKQLGIPTSSDPTKCSVCKGKTGVNDTNVTKEGIVRRRYCRACGRKFNTIELRQQEFREKVAMADPHVILRYQAAMKAIGTIVSTTKKRT